MVGLYVESRQELLPLLSTLLVVNFFYHTALSIKNFSAGRDRHHLSEKKFAAFRLQKRRPL